MHGKPDLERELTARGRRDAVAAGEWLQQHAPPVDRVVCSTSARTRQTWEGVRRGGVSAGAVDHRAAVYDAEPGTLLDLVRRTPDEVRLPAPGRPRPGRAPAGRGSSSPADAPDPMPDGCPTSGFAVLRFDGGWGDLGPGGAELVEFVVARGD